MASSSSSAYSYDVFLSFRGKDTRFSFTDHLYKALREAGFRTFRDDDEIEEGEKLKPELENAIRKSRASIIVLSENYASSTWCLNELVMILERMNSDGHTVLPIFYHVEPSDVKKQENSFAEAFAEHNRKIELETDQERKLKRMENIERWRTALTEVADLKFRVADRHETKFIPEIVTKIYHKLNRKVSSTLGYLVGMRSRVQDINSWLRDGSSYIVDIRSIWGMGGIGKTTTAQHCYDLNSKEFESSCFLQEIRRNCNSEVGGLLSLQKQLLANIRKGTPQELYNEREATTIIEEALTNRKVLLVLDDVDEVDQLDKLLGTKVFHPGSKILITTREKSLPEKCVVLKLDISSRRYKEHTLQKLDTGESLELLSHHAFRPNESKEAFEEQSRNIVKYCGGIPLALKVLGRTLDGENVGAWKGTLELLERENNIKIQKILQISYDSLPSENDKNLFLHIACFFVGEDKSYIEERLGCYFVTSIGIPTLIKRCLLTVGPRNTLMMHQLLQDMGREIVRQESPDEPEGRSRLWGKEAFNVLSERMGTQKIKGLALDMQEQRDIYMKYRGFYDIEDLEIDSFTGMDKLTLLQLKNIKLAGDYRDFPKRLMWLCWYKFPEISVPSSFHMRSLVALDMHFSNLERFEAPELLRSLKILDLSCSSKLIEIVNISRLPNLESLKLYSCSSLVEVDRSIGKLCRLILLDLSGCEMIRSPQLLLASLPPSLVKLSLAFWKLPDHSFPMDLCKLPLKYLNLSSNLIDSVPEFVSRLDSLHSINLDYCESLQRIAGLPSTIKQLSLNNCISLEEITFLPTLLKLPDISFNSCEQLSKIQGLFRLAPLAEVDMEVISNLGWSNLRSIQNLEQYLKRDWMGAVNFKMYQSMRQIQILYEFGICSTFFPGTALPTWFEHKCKGDQSMYFKVPKDRRIQGLNLCCLYCYPHRLRHDPMLFVKIKNMTKDLSWMYSPYIYGFTMDGKKDVVWLSHWRFGNQLQAGDEVYITPVVDKISTLKEFGYSFVYHDEQEEEKETQKNSMMEVYNWEEIIGRDLPAFQLSNGAYYLCRCDFLKYDLTTPEWFEILVDKSIKYTEVQGWGKLGRRQEIPYLN